MTQFAKETLPISLEEEMRRSYLDYAMSVIEVAAPHFFFKTDGQGFFCKLGHERPG